MSPLWKIAARVRAIDPLRKDVALALAFGVAVAIEAAFSESTEGHVLSTAVAGVVAVVPSLALRRRAPFPAAAFFIVVTLMAEAFGSSLGNELATPLAAVLVLFYSLGRHAEGRSLWAGFVGLTIGLIAIVAIDGGAAGDFVYVIGLCSMPFLAGRAVRSRVLLQRELRVKALRLEADRDQRALRAVDDERGRIAEELQTVVANGLSAMVVHAGAVPRVLSAGDSAGAGASFLVIEETGRDALSEMRRLLGVLRRGDEGPSLAPQPGLGRLEPLLERLRETGLEVKLTIQGDSRPLPTGIDLTAYRVVQEGVDSARAAGAAAAALTIRYNARDLELELSDDRPPGADGGAMPGLRERVRLYGGRISSGADNGAGHRVRTWLPVEEASAR